MVSTVRPYVYGDAINRIHWLSSVRHGELIVKEFDLEQAADLWLLLDLQRAAHAGSRESASVETAVSAAASIAVHTLGENRAVGITVSSRRQQHLNPDRGTRVEQKILNLLANVQADGSQPLAEVVVSTLPQLRRGMTLCIVTGSTDREWVRALASLRRRGIGTIVVLLDRFSFAGRDDDESRAELAAVRHALAEYDIAAPPAARGRRPLQRPRAPGDRRPHAGHSGADPCLSGCVATCSRARAGAARAAAGHAGHARAGPCSARSGSTTWTTCCRSRSSPRWPGPCWG